MDPTGESDVSQLLQTSRNLYISAAVATQIDSPAIGPGDVIGLGIAIGATGVLAYAGFKSLFGLISSSISNTGTKTENKKNVPTTIYRTGSGNGTNLTPRTPKDSTGLSYSLSKPDSGPYTVTTMEAVNKMEFWVL